MYERNYNLLNAKFRELFFPTLFTSMSGNISIFIDSLIVSNLLGASILASMQPISPLTTFVNLIYWMIGLGGSVLCSVAKAEFDDKKSNSIFSVSITSLVAIGVLITLLCLLFRDQIVHLLCPYGDTSLFKQFYSVYVFALPFLCYLMSMSYFVRTDGFSQLPFRASLLSNGVNLVMDVVLIAGFNLGLKGAALATVLGYMVGCIYISTYYFNSKRTLQFIQVKIKSRIRHLMNICKSGFSSASTQLYFTIKIYVINMLLLLYIGQSGLTAFNICFNSLIIVSMFIIGTAQTMSPIISVYYKETDYSGVNFVTKRSLKIVIISSLIISLLFIVYPDILLMLYHVNNANDIPVVFNAVRLFAISYVGVSITSLYMYYTQAIQENKLSSTVSLLEGLILPVSLATILSSIMGVNGIWISFAVAELLTILFIYAYSKYKTKKTNGEYKGLFINKQVDDNENVLEFTLKGDIKEAVDLSEKVQGALKDIKSGTLVSLAIEEMVVNIININEDIDFIDVIIKLEDECTLISIKDMGVEFNPVKENDELEFDNISLLNKIAYKIDYTHVLGLNSTVIKIKN